MSSLFFVQKIEKNFKKIKKQEGKLLTSAENILRK